MLKLRKIAITGGVASGKSSACRFFQELGACVVYADSISHELLAPDTDLGRQIIRHFGSDLLHEGKVDRRALADRVFEDPKQLQALEGILHPAIFRRIEELYAEASRSGKYTLFVVEIPLLYEIQGELFYDAIVAVQADEAICRRRFAQEGFQEHEYDRRMKRQLSPKDKALRADHVLSNDKTLADLRREVVKLYPILQRDKRL